METVNDKDAYLSNFWRALRADPQGVAQWADWPVNEVDLHARHLWLVNTGKERVERLLTDPDYYDVKVAGWWVWGICQWIGSGWCTHPELKQRPHLSTDGQGYQTPRQIPYLAGHGQGVHQPSHQLPHLGDGGRGVHRAPHRKRPHLMHAGKGDGRPSLQLPMLSAAGRGIHRPAATEGLYAYFDALSERLRRVRVCCGDWTRVLGPSVTEKLGITAILLDPPYSDAARDGELYAQEDLTVAHAVREWAIANGDNPKLRIALCGYESEHEMPDSWECVAWKAAGGYGSQNRNGYTNGARERIWFNKSCLSPEHQPIQLNFIEERR